MSTFINITAHTPDTIIEIVGGQFATVAEGKGKLACILPNGIYNAVFKTYKHGFFYEHIYYRTEQLFMVENDELVKFEEKINVQAS